MNKKEEENKKLKEDYKEIDRIKVEIMNSKDFQEYIGLRNVYTLVGERTDFLLFRLNKNLERIADSLDAIFLKL